MTKVILLLLAFANLTVAGPVPMPTPTATPTPTPTPIPVSGIHPAITLPANFKLVWNQDFTTPAYANINTSGVLSSGDIVPPAIWSTRPVGAPANYTNAGVDHQPFSTDSGWLDISLFNNSAGSPSGGIMTSAGNRAAGFRAANAYWEACIKLPNGGGSNQWPIWWFTTIPYTPDVAPGAGEVDILEGGWQTPANAVGGPIHLHNWTATSNGGSAGDSQIQNFSKITADGFHVYSCWFQTGTVTIYLDGVKFVSFNVGPNFSTPMETILQMTTAAGNTSATPGTLSCKYVRCWTAQW